MKRTSCFIAWATLAALPQLAQAQNTSADEPWLRCRGISEAAARLACYDAVKPTASANAAAARAAPTAAPTATPTPAAANTAATPDQNFGLEQKAEAQSSTLRSSLPGNFEGWSSSTVFKLANGQSWRVSDGSSAYYRLKDPAVTIKRGALGSYLMDIAGVNQSIRVRRLD